MLLTIKKEKFMIITRANPSGGRPLRGYPLCEDPDTGLLGYKVGYCGCGCDQPLLIRTVDVRQIVDKFGGGLSDYQRWYDKLKPKQSLKHLIIKALGGRVAGD